MAQRDDHILGDGLTVVSGMPQDLVIGLHCLCSQQAYDDYIY